MLPPPERRALFFIFACSGLAGLVYESIWTHYLKLFLGHAAHAQTLVLAIFMGGMALGSWASSRLSGRWRRLLAGYALVEAIVGVGGLAFHPLFEAFLDWAYGSAMPGLATPALVSLFQWTTAGLLILPQSVLLGMTFPLLAAGVVRSSPDDQGRTIATLYFTNSLGAAVGVLASGFWLIGWVGLPGTIAVAGLINLAIAGVVWSRWGRLGAAPLVARDSEPGRPTGIDSTHRLLLVLSLVTGLASFVYEIAWLRMLSLVLSSSTHAFELMLSAFILGLALGGFWIRRRIDQLEHPIRFLAMVQVAMGCLALATLPVYARTFEAMAWLVQTLPRSGGGYVLFNLASHLLASAVMLPATFCAGMTLPLITAILLRRGHGESSIGAVYALNTVGAIAGVLLAVHLAMPALGLEGLVGVGAGLDIGFGVVLAWWAFPGRRVPVTTTIAGAAALLVTLTVVRLEPHRMASGVYRKGEMLDPGTTEVLYHRDGTTATVSVTRDEAGTVAIRTNGKVDAGLNVLEASGPREDELTMVLTGALPLALHPGARTAANIGMGSGLTTHTLLCSPRLSRVDTIEIEPFMVEGARFFEPRVPLAFGDPRSRLLYEDAKRYFSTSRGRFDLIVSEPSNPWVSGVSSLFTREFYRRVGAYLEPGGLLVQWLQLYEIDLTLVASVMKALASEFSDYTIFAANSGDIIIAAAPAGRVPPLSPGVFDRERLAAELTRVGIAGPGDLEIRSLGNKQALGPLFETFPIDANSDYRPVLDLGAGRARFLGSSATELLSDDLELLPALEMLGGEGERGGEGPVSPSPYLGRAFRVRLARMIYRYHLDGIWRASELGRPLPANIRTYADAARGALHECAAEARGGSWLNGMFNNVAKRLLPYLTPAELDELWNLTEAESCRSGLSDLQADFLLLLKAVGHRDARLMADGASALLREAPGMHPTLREYVLGAGMLGELARDEGPQALALWRAHAPRLSPQASESLLLRLLVAHSLLPGPDPAAFRREFEILAAG